MLRSVFAGFTTVVMTVILGMSALFLTLVNRRGDWVLRVGRIWARAIVAASGVEVEGRGLENVPRDRPVILLSNHVSNFDMLALILTMPVSFRVVAKRFLFHIPIFGWCLRLSGMIPIDRAKRARAFQSLEEAAERIKTGVPILFFPEGTRGTGRELLPFKKGAFVIAVKSGVPIVPVSVAGSADILPKGSIRIRPGRIVVTYGPEIPVRSYSLETKETLMARVREAIASGLDDTPAAPPMALPAAPAGPAAPVS